MFTVWHANCLSHVKVNFTSASLAFAFPQMFFSAAMPSCNVSVMPAIRNSDLHVQGILWHRVCKSELYKTLQMRLFEQWSLVLFVYRPPFVSFLPVNCLWWPHRKASRWVGKLLVCKVHLNSHCFSQIFPAILVVFLYLPLCSSQTLK